MKISFIKLAQEILKKRVEPDLEVDGFFGKNSIIAARKFAVKFQDRLLTANRWIAAVIQQEAILVGSPTIPAKIEYDAWWGPDTQDTAYRLIGENHVGWRPDENQTPTNDANEFSVKCWTPTDSQMIKKYGNPGLNQVVINLPFTMRLDWDLQTRVNKTSCHSFVKDSITGVLEEIRDSYGIVTIKELGIDRFGGILNVRKKRGGKTWSAHAWGTAIDLWPSANQLAWKKNRAAFAKSEYDKLHEIFAKAGWMSLGKCYDFDWMHWQLNP
jgi:hypothetical protein